MTIHLNNSAVARAMRNAAARGFDPRNSHPAMAATWSRAWYDKARRAREAK